MMMWTLKPYCAMLAEYSGRHLARQTGAGQRRAIQGVHREALQEDAGPALPHHPALACGAGANSVGCLLLRLMAHDSSPIAQNNLASDQCLQFALSGPCWSMLLPMYIFAPI